MSLPWSISCVLVWPFVKWEINPIFQSSGSAFEPSSYSRFYNLSNCVISTNFYWYNFIEIVSFSPVFSDLSLLPKDPYKVILVNPAYDRKQRYQCANCPSDIPSGHYYLQCDKVCQFKDWISKNSLPHWGNTFPILTNHLKSKERTQRYLVRILPKQSINLIL